VGNKRQQGRIRQKTRVALAILAEWSGPLRMDGGTTMEFGTSGLLVLRRVHPNTLLHPVDPPTCDRCVPNPAGDLYDIIDMLEAEEAMNRGETSLPSSSRTGPKRFDRMAAGELWQVSREASNREWGGQMRRCPAPERRASSL
jgi:hypothetical protein